jgi:hypothetical protein
LRKPAVAALLPNRSSSAHPMHDPNAFEKIAFYFAAHQDDWQLFMNPAAFEDVVDPVAKTVFIHVTAGDAGLGAGSGGRKHPLYLARENGAETAIRFMADADGLPVEKTDAQMIFNGHPVRRVGYRNTVACFFRVADGNFDGAGFPTTNHQSLKRLLTGEINALDAIDGSTSYRGWNDLVATVRAVLDFERGDIAGVELHVPETDPTINPDDHSDHMLTAQLALDAAQHIPHAQHVCHLGYASVKRPENLSALQRDLKCAVYAVTLAGVLALDHRVSWRHYDETFVGRNYFRVEQKSS